MKYIIFPLCLLSINVVSAELEHYVNFGISDGYTALYDSSFTPSIGYHVVSGKAHRWSATVSHAVDYNYTTMVGAYDYLYSVAPKWALLVGASTGYSHSDVDDGVLAGGRVGAMYEAAKNLKLEFGYRAEDTIDNWKNRDMSRIETLYFGVNMKV
ncbi:hypothetical protein L4C33_08120 [Vibrio makurazakiensis]|uniref:hypothetical protein n=1 Tax=Vibrio makurazakiensis TaxID=2910250 RepID=UPI003D096EED